MQGATPRGSLKNCCAIYQQVSQPCFSGFQHTKYKQLLKCRSDEQQQQNHIINMPLMFGTTFSYLFPSHRSTVLMILRMRFGFKTMLCDSSAKSPGVGFSFPDPSLNYSRPDSSPRAAAAACPPKQGPG